MIFDGTNTRSEEHTGRGDRSSEEAVESGPSLLEMEALRRVIDHVSIPESLEEARRQYKGYLDEAWGDALEGDMSPVDEIFASKLFVSKNSSDIVGKGSSQLVLRLSDEWVAKAANYHDFEDYYAISEYPKHISCRSTVEIFESEFGLSIPMLTVDYAGSQPGGKIVESTIDRGLFMIVPNLTLGGRYIVEDIDPDEDFAGFGNSEEVRAQFAEYMRFFDRLKEDDRYEITVNSHGNKDASGREAYRRMFFLQMDSNTNTARVVLGDFDNVYISRR